MANRILSFVLFAAMIHGSFAFFSGIDGHAADRPRLRWIVKDGIVVDRARGERLYREACRVIESRFAAGGKAVRPEITVHVGKACPDAGVAGACLGPASNELFLPQWDESSPAAVAQAALIVGLLQLLDPREIADVAKTLLTEDAKDFVDAHSLAATD